MDKKRGHFRRFWWIYLIALVLVVLLIILVCGIFSVSKQFLGPMISLKSELENQGFSNIGVQSDVNYNFGDENKKISTLTISSIISRDSFGDENTLNETFSKISGYMFNDYSDIGDYDKLRVVVGTKYKIYWIIPITMTESREYDVNNLTVEYMCPTLKGIDCMPVVNENLAKYCEKDYRAWIESNCNVSVTD